LISVLVDRADAGRLDRLGASPDKSLAKSARKALHLLSTRGTKAPTAPRVYRATGPYADGPPPSYASIIDGRGERVVWYVAPRDGGYGVYEVELSETAGIMSLTSRDIARKRWRDQVAHMKRSERALVGEIPGVHARVLIEAGYRRVLEEGRSAPEGFAGAHLSIQASDEELAAPHPLRAIVANLAAPSDGELAALLERVELSLFVPSRDVLTALDAAIGEVMTSTTVEGAEQKLGQIEAAIARAVDAIDATERAHLADRLLELGLLIASRQPDDAGRAAAHACLVASDRARSLTGPAHTHPTLLAMVRRLVPAELILQISEAPAATETR